MHAPVPQSQEARGGMSAGGGRRVVMITSPGVEPTLSDVAINLATVCAETGQRVAILSTAGLAAPNEAGAVDAPATLWWQSWPGVPEGSGASRQEEQARLTSGPLHPADVEGLLGHTGVAGVSRLDLRYFVGHPAQVVVRMPDVLAALREVVDVVILEVPSYTSVHHGEGLTPLADVVLVVGERETTTVEQARRTSATLRKLGAPVVGMALTGGRTHQDLWGGDAEVEEGDEAPEGDEVAEAEVSPASAPGADPAPGADRVTADEPDVTAPLRVSGPAGEAGAEGAGNGSEGPVVSHARSEA